MRLLIGGLLLLLISLYSFFAVEGFLDSDGLARREQVGEIRAQSNDVRHKADGSFVWYRSKLSQSIRIGDTVFSGERSTALVQLKKGGDLTLGENSLVTFREIEREKITDLNWGNFRIKVDGSVKVAVNGTISEIAGSDSELQVLVSKHQKPQVRLIKGNATLKSKGKVAVQLNRATPFALDPQESQVTRAQPLPETPASLSEAKTIKYIWRLSDLYDQKDFLLFEKTKETESLPVSVPLSWGRSKQGASATVQLSSNADFQKFSSYESAEGQLRVSPVVRGVNYWRVSFDKTNWSLTERFEVVADFLENSEPSASVGDLRILLFKEKATAEVLLRTREPMSGFVVEAAKEPDFKAGETRSFWSASNQLKLSFYQPGIYYYRFRSVNNNQELSRWSSATRFEVFRPAMPGPPQLLSARRELSVGETLELKWNTRGKKAWIEFLDDNGRVAERIPGSKVSRVMRKAQRFVAQARIVDEYGRVSEPSRPVQVHVAEGPSVPALAETLPLAPVKSEPVRAPAAVETSTVTKMELPRPNRNEKYKHSTLSAYGFLWSLQSSQQYYQSEQSPVVTGVGVNALHWFRNSGVEGKLKVGAVGVNEAGRDTALKDVELRYHYRIHTGFPFGLSRELQLSGFGGVEIYRNEGALFAKQYDLVKFGTSIDFPWRQNWSTGGEFVYGAGVEGSSKYEMSGRLFYFPHTDWSLGVGYRLNLFESGSAKTAPAGVLPYREGYIEGYSILNYHF